MMQRYSLIASFLLFSNLINYLSSVFLLISYSDQSKPHKLQAPLGDYERQYATPEDIKHLLKLEGVSTSGLNKENVCATSSNKHHRDDTSTRVAHTLMQSTVTTPDDHLISNLAIIKDDEMSDDEDDYDEELDIEDDINHQGAASSSG